MKGWWPLIKLKSQEDIEREEREAEQEKKNKKKKKKKQSKRSKMKPEDLQFVDSSGNTFLLMVLKEDSAVMSVIMIIVVMNIGFVVKQCNDIGNSQSSIQYNSLFVF